MKRRTPLIVPVERSKKFVLAKFDYFLEVHLLPIQNLLNPRRWLENFRKSEMDHAVHLLNAFLYYSEVLVDEMFVSSIHDLSNVVRPPDSSYSNALKIWQSFMDEVIITYVPEEIPRTIDKGIGYAKKAQHLLSIPKERILSPEDALRKICTRPLRKVIFVDDLVDTGVPFKKIWKRKIKLDNNLTVSFEDISHEQVCNFFYCPLICTEEGKAHIERHCAGIIFRPVHLLPPDYSVLAEDSIIWPPHLLPTAIDFLKTVSKRAGIPDSNGLEVNDWRGFGKLGLTVAFAHAIPDATLPIFSWNENGWKPLVQKK